MRERSCCRPPVGRRPWGRPGDQSGAALVEFALVAGLFMFILYGLIWFGMMLALKQGITNAAAEGARSVVGVVDAPGGADERVEKARTTVANRLSWLGGNFSPGDVTVDAPTTCAGGTGTCITVKISYPWKDRPIIPAAPGLGLVSPTSFGAEATVQIA